MAKFNGWYFQHNGAESLIYIVSKEFWDANGILDDSHIDFLLEGILPYGFYEACESMFETEYSVRDAKKLLKDAGFKEMKLIEE